MGDNRNYVYDEAQVTNRSEYRFIEFWIKDKARVIDLGCGDGALLQRLKKNKQIEGEGIEIAESGVGICLKNGLKVSQGRIDTDLTIIPENTFDYAICNVTLQMVMNPEVLLREMRRIARFQIVSFPNFAFLWQRLELMFLGRMPRKLLYGYDWFSTGHIHQLSIKDFRRTVLTMDFKVRDVIYLLGRYELILPVCPNLMATEAIFLLEKNDRRIA